MTVIMKIDLVGPRRRGLALGLNEFAGYFAVGTMAWVTGYIAGHYALRPQPFYLGIAIAVAGLLMSIFLVRETRDYVKLEATSGTMPTHPLSLGRIFYVTTLGNVSLFAACQAGLVNNLNDGMSWGLYPLFFSAHGLDVERIGIVKAVYPIVWGLLQIATGMLSDRVGRKGLIAWGMVVQAVGIWLTVLMPAYGAWLLAAALQGLGTAMVYPTLLAAIADHAHPTWRASSLGVYRFWRDLGYAIGALLSGLVADAIDLEAAIHVVAALTLLSGGVVGLAMRQPAPGPTSGSLAATMRDKRRASR
jgi:MFS family permease